MRYKNNKFLTNHLDKNLLFLYLQTKSSLDRIFYKVVYHHIIYMCDFCVNLDDFFVVVCTGFHESCGFHLICFFFVLPNLFFSSFYQNIHILVVRVYVSEEHPCRKILIWVISYTILQRSKSNKAVFSSVGCKRKIFLRFESFQFEALNEVYL